MEQLQAKGEKGAPSLLILVGSQTGTAEELGGRLAFVAQKHGLPSRLLPFDQYDMVEPLNKLVVLFE
jgi:sulfite reductase alpha subunit-like flavoprotein